MSVDIRRGSDRFVDRTPGRRTAHAFSFGSHYDPDHVSFGPMVCHDDHLLAEGQGFDDHSHRDLVIVSCVLSGAVRHTDTTGATNVLEPGDIGVLRTGGTVVHSEFAAAPATRFVQVWLTDTAPGGEASYEVTESPVTPIPSATLRHVRLGPGETFTTPVASKVHVFVARGALLRSSLAEPLHDGDAFLFADEGSYDLASGADTELLVWSFGGQAITERAPGSSSTTAG